jgi:hypothetical protein
LLRIGGDPCISGLPEGFVFCQYRKIKSPNPTTAIHHVL